MKQRLLQIGIPLVGILACAVLLPPIMVTPILLLVMSTLFRGGLRWRWQNLAISLAIAVAAVVIVSMALIKQFTADYSVFDFYSLNILTFWGMCIMLPWLLGLGVGSLWLMKKPQSEARSVN